MDLVWEYCRNQKKVMYCCCNFHSECRLSLLVVLAIRVLARRAFIKDCRALVDTSKLHGVKEKFRVATLWARLFNCCMFLRPFPILFCSLLLTNPFWLYPRCTSGYNFVDFQLRKLTLKLATGTRDFIVFGNIENGGANRTKGKKLLFCCSFVEVSRVGLHLMGCF